MTFFSRNYLKLNYEKIIGKKYNQDKTTLFQGEVLESFLEQRKALFIGQNIYCALDHVPMLSNSSETQGQNKIEFEFCKNSKIIFSGFSPFVAIMRELKARKTYFV